MAHRRPLWIVLGIAGALLLLVFGAMAWVESEAGRHWVERKASEATGREITIGDIDIKLGWQPGIRVSGLRITNPDWAKTRHLVDTEYIDARFRLLSLLVARPVVEELTLVQAKIGAEREENRNTWTFRKKEEEQEDKPFPAIVRRVNIDRGYVLLPGHHDRHGIGDRRRGRSRRRGSHRTDRQRQGSGSGLTRSRTLTCLVADA